MMKEIFYDWFGWNQQIFFALNGFDAPVLGALMHALGVVGDYRSFPIYLIAGLIVAWTLRRAGHDSRAHDVHRALWRFALGYAIGVVLVGDLKVAFDFQRPFSVFGPAAIHLLPGTELRYSLPSGHAAFAALLAMSAWPLCRPYGRLVLFLFALAVGWSRIWSGVHFPADVIAGYGCGVVAGWLAQQLLRIAKRNRAAGTALLGALAVFALDQASKTAVVLALRLHDTIALTDFFNLVYWHNTGAAFSLLADAGGWQRGFFLVVGFAAAGVLGYLLWRGVAKRIDSAGYALIMGGALGNTVDRLLRGAVVDYLDFYWQEWHWPAFNLADSAITVGAVMLLLSAFRPIAASDSVRA